MSHGLLLMLENIDRRKNEIVPLDTSLDAEILQDQHKQLMVRTLVASAYFFAFCIIISHTPTEAPNLIPMVSNFCETNMHRR